MKYIIDVAVFCGPRCSNNPQKSPLKDLKYALWQRDLGEMGELDENQVDGHVFGNYVG